MTEETAEPREAEYLRLALAGTTFPDRGEESPLSGVEQALNRIAMWKREVRDLIPDNVETDLANPNEMLASLIKEVWHLARKPVIHGWETEAVTLTDVAEAVEWLDSQYGDGIEFTSADWSRVEETGAIEVEGRDAEGRLVDVTFLIDEVYVRSAEPEFETHESEDEDG